MTDRELLERAARVVGKVPTGLWSAGRMQTLAGWWNPLEDDGDALRLAYALNMDIYFGNDEDGEPIITASPVELPRSKCPSIVDVNDGSLRRAIVRAAAAMADT